MRGGLREEAAARELDSAPRGGGARTPPDDGTVDGDDEDDDDEAAVVAAERAAVAAEAELRRAEDRPAAAIDRLAAAAAARARRPGAILAPGGLGRVLRRVTRRRPRGEACDRDRSSRSTSARRGIRADGGASPRPRSAGRRSRGPRRSRPVVFPRPVAGVAYRVIQRPRPTATPSPRLGCSHTHNVSLCRDSRITTQDAAGDGPGSETREA